MNNPDCAMAVRPDVKIAVTNMDPIEQRIVPELCEKNLQLEMR